MWIETLLITNTTKISFLFAIEHYLDFSCHVLHSNDKAGRVVKVFSQKTVNAVGFIDAVDACSEAGPRKEKLPFLKGNWRVV